MNNPLNVIRRPDPAVNLALIRQAIAEACAQTGRDPETVTLVAAAKTVGPETIERAITAGQMVFGENRVQEAKAKWPMLSARHPDVQLHLIGPLQTNKAREAVSLFDVIQSVDRPGLCAVLAEQCTRQKRTPTFFVQVNTGAEPQKTGVPLSSVDAFVASCREEYGLEITGLMCIPPAGANPGPHFSALRQAAERNGLPSLSMGMSGDYAQAVRCGATHVRVGSAIFGQRHGNETK